MSAKSVAIFNSLPPDVREMFSKCVATRARTLALTGGEVDGNAAPARDQPGPLILFVKAAIRCANDHFPGDTEEAKFTVAMFLASAEMIEDRLREIDPDAWTPADRVAYVTAHCPNMWAASMRWQTGLDLDPDSIDLADFGDDDAS